MNNLQKYLVASEVKYNVIKTIAELKGEMEKKFQVLMDDMESKCASWFAALPCEAATAILSTPRREHIAFPFTFSIQDVRIKDVGGDGDDDDNDESYVESVVKYSRADAAEKILAKYGFNNGNTFWNFDKDTVRVEIDLTIK
jgi:hypothetical protein